MSNYIIRIISDTGRTFIFAKEYFKDNLVKNYE